jgi:two-component system cell cycle sensor histidine kinase/response regulator CckA
MSTLAKSENRPSPTTPMRILHLEDNPNDRELVREAMALEGLLCQFTYVTTRADYQATLKAGQFDLILSDFTLPGFDGFSALTMARETAPEVPYLFLSGTIGELQAIDSLKNGATDYVLKGHLERLVPAVRRALREVEERAQRRRVEEQLRQAQKMEAIGQLAGGIAHDFNNILTIINGNAGLLLDNENLDPETVEALKQIFAAGERAASLTRQLLVFSRKQIASPQVIDLNDLIEESAKMLRRLIGERITLELDLAGKPPVIQADASMMEQVLLNLIVNARDAMPRGGRLIIRTQGLTITTADTQHNPEARPGDFVRLSVQDTGGGIAPEVLPRIFEPLFTTKEAGKGTGLGLATVFGIVRQHQGWLEVKSQLGEGTVFEVLLPTISATAAPGQSAAAPAKAPGGSETILLVEDETAVRELAVIMLEKHGYRVLQAASGAEALKVWERHGARIKLLLTDLVMPGELTGWELAERLQTANPALKVIFASGYSAEATAQIFDAAKNFNFLQKPYHMRTLAGTVRQVLDGTAVGTN